MTTVKIQRGEKKGTQLVLVEGNKGITKEQAIKSLGKNAKKFVVKDWKEKDTESS